jgi:nitrogenase molybdenum-cofactor synthesis protein NifE
MPDDAFHYMAPDGGGWGVVRMALTVPESAVLMAAPLVCGRGSAIRALQLGYRRRFFFLELSERDAITGAQAGRIEEAASEILDEAKGRIKALFLCATCIDDLLGTDYSSIERRLAERHHTEVRTIALKPIAADGKRPSGLVTQEAMYDLLEPSALKDGGLNVLGSMSPIDSSSELHAVLAAAGFGPLRHVGSCSSFAEFQMMGRSRNNLLVRPSGRLAAKLLERKLGIPSVHAPVSYGLETVDWAYAALGEALGRDLPIDRARAEAVDAIEAFRVRRRRAPRVAVGSSVNASAFELARALIGYGLDVHCVFANAFLDYDIPHIAWLKEKAPKLRVYAVSHTSMAEFLDWKLSVDLAFGFEAGYFCSASPTVNLSSDRQDFGYRAIESLLDTIERELSEPKPHRESMYATFIQRAGV